MDSCTVCFEKYTTKSGHHVTDTDSIVSCDDPDKRCIYILDDGNRCKKSKYNNLNVCRGHSDQIAKIDCPHCMAHFCRVCYRQYLLDFAIQEPACLHCKKRFDIEMLITRTGSIQHLSPSFMWGAYSEYKKEMLFQMVRSQFPNLQDRVAVELEHDACKDNLDKLGSRTKDLNEAVEYNEELIASMKMVVDDPEVAKVFTNVLLEERVEHYETLNKTYNIRINSLRQEQINQNDKLIQLERRKKEIGVSDPEKHNDYVHRGPCQVENCKGFIKEKWECGLCKTKICSKCRVIKTEGHECDEDDVLAVKTISEITKPCPNCRLRIEKAYGCDSMWCSNCHTFFNWHTGAVNNRNAHIHNPEALDYERRRQLTDPTFTLQGRAGGFVGGGDCLNMNKIEELECLLLSEAYRNVMEILDNLDNYGNNYEGEYIEHSVQYLKNKIDIDKLKFLLHKTYKASIKDEYTNNYKRTFANICLDILHSTYIDYKKDKKKYKELAIAAIDEIITRKRNTEKYLTNLGTIFKSSAPKLLQRRRERRGVGYNYGYDRRSLTLDQIDEVWRLADNKNCIFDKNMLNALITKVKVESR